MLEIQKLSAVWVTNNLNEKTKRLFTITEKNVSHQTKISYRY
jgi:hypothetical protein